MHAKQRRAGATQREAMRSPCRVRASAPLRSRDVQSALPMTGLGHCRQPRSRLETRRRQVQRCHAARQQQRQRPSPHGPGLRRGRTARRSRPRRRGSAPAAAPARGRRRPAARRAAARPACARPGARADPAANGSLTPWRAWALADSVTAGACMPIKHGDKCQGGTTGMQSCDAGTPMHKAVLAYSTGGGGAPSSPS